MDELEKERQELVRQRDEVMKFLSEISLTEETDEEEKEAIRRCHKNIQECKALMNDPEKDRKENKKITRKKFTLSQQVLLSQTSENFGNTPTNEHIKWLSEQTGVETKRLNKHFRNKRYKEQKTRRKRFNSEIVTKSEMDKYIHGHNENGKSVYV
jgi:hypothetical protein